MFVSMGKWAATIVLMLKWSEASVPWGEMVYYICVNLVWSAALLSVGNFTTTFVSVCKWSVAFVSKGK